MQVCLGLCRCICVHFAHIYVYVYVVMKVLIKINVFTFLYMYVSCNHDIFTVHRYSYSVLNKLNQSVSSHTNLGRYLQCS